MHGCSICGPHLWSPQTTENLCPGHSESWHAGSKGIYHWTTNVERGGIYCVQSITTWCMMTHFMIHHQEPDRLAWVIMISTPCDLQKHVSIRMLIPFYDMTKGCTKIVSSCLPLSIFSKILQFSCCSSSLLSFHLPTAHTDVIANRSHSFHYQQFT